MTSAFSDEKRKIMEADRESFPDDLTPFDHPQLQTGIWENPGLEEFWISKDFSVRVFRREDGTEKLSISRNIFNKECTGWEDGITWDEIQDIKRQCGREEEFFIEIYPPDSRIVNQGNYRHIWLIRKEDLDKLPFFWANLKDDL